MRIMNKNIAVTVTCDLYKRDILVCYLRMCMFFPLFFEISLNSLQFIKKILKTYIVIKL